MSQQLLWNFDTTISPDDVLFAMPKEGRVTRLTIARAMRRAKSPSLVRAINQLVQCGVIEQTFVTLPNGVDMYAYEVTGLGLPEWLRVINERIPF